MLIAVNKTESKHYLTYQILWFDGSVNDFPEEAVVFLVLDIEDQTAILVFVLGAIVPVVEAEHAVFDFTAQLKKSYEYRF